MVSTVPAPPSPTQRWCSTSWLLGWFPFLPAPPSSNLPSLPAHPSLLIHAPPQSTAWSLEYSHLTSPFPPEDMTMKIVTFSFADTPSTYRAHA